MPSLSTVCYLKCVSNPQKRINLPNGKTVFIGRNEETAIADPHVSRKHLECTADLNNLTVAVKTLGKSYSGCNGYALVQDESYSLKNGDIIEVRLGLHEYEIIFEPADTEESVPVKKQRLDFCAVGARNSKKYSTSG